MDKGSEKKIASKFKIRKKTVKFRKKFGQNPKKFGQNSKKIRAVPENVSRPNWSIIENANLKFPRKSPSTEVDIFHSLSETFSEEKSYFGQIFDKWPPDS